MACGNGEEFIVTWYIENYSYCSDENGQVIESPLFRSERLGGCKWKLHLVPRFTDDKEKEVTQCFLKRYDKSGKIWIDYKIEMLDPKGIVLKTVEAKNEEFVGDSDSTLEIESDELDIQKWNENTLTIRCSMKNGGPRRQPAIGCEVRTKIELESLNFPWGIKLPLINTAEKEFFIFDKTRLKIELSKSGMSCQDPVVIRISKVESDPPLRRFVSCKIALLDGSGAIVKYKCGMHFFKPADDKWEYPSFLENLDLEKYSHERKKATLQFEFTVTNGMKSETPPVFQYSTMADGLLTLQNDMRRLFLSQQQADVELRLENETTLAAHKSILIARSPVFSKMLDKDWNESNSGIVEVTEDETTMRAFLEYLYTGTVEKMDSGCAKNLLQAGEKYQVPSLKDKCATYLMNALTTTNVCEILVFANLIEHQQLKNIALDFIAVHLKEIMPLPEWSTVAKECELVEEILSTMAEKFKIVPKTAADQITQT